ncbi:MAG: OmpA family protein [Bacteroidota bacterium]
MNIYKKTQAVLFLSAVFSISNINIQAQNKNDFEDIFNEAEKYFPSEKTAYYADLSENSKKAIPLYAELLKLEPRNANVNYKMGRCYLNSRTEPLKAIPFLELAVKSTSVNYKQGYEEKNAPILAYVFLADAYHLNYKFDAAITNYQKYNKLALTTKVKPEELKEIDRKIEICKTAKLLVAKPVSFKIDNLGNTINSAYPDYSQVVSADESVLIYTSRKPGSVGGDIDVDGNYAEDIYISNKTENGWQAAENIGKSINTKSNEASIGMSVDGQQVFIYKDDNSDGNIYSTTLDGDEWSKPEKLNPNINTEHWEPSAFVSADGNVLYFTSNRPGGFGGRDIYKSHMNKNKEWGPAINLGSTINTAYEEDSPFIHPDGVTLFFSSTGHKTMGGFDIFSTKMLDNNTWTAPKNVGYPINTTGDDIYYSVSPDKKRAYFSSFRKDGLGEKDIYAITFELPDECPSLSLFKGVVLDADGKPAKQVQIVISDNETGEEVGTYYTNKKTGKYFFILPPGKNYNISYESNGQLFYSENRNVVKDPKYCEFQKEITLPALIIGAKVVLDNIFFEFDKAILTPASNVELGKVLRFLNNNPNLIVEISGYTDSEGTEEYNSKLSRERAEAVVVYLVNKGIKAERLSAKGYGETNASAPNQNKDGSDNPSGRKLNRRVELKITGV